MRALTFSRFGGPEVLQLRDVPDPKVSAHSVLVRTRAIGLNFADVYRRRGTYKLEGSPPYIAGYEGAGTVEAVGSRVHGVAVGDRVAFADVAFANAELVAAPADRLIPLPEHISFDTAAATILQGLTAHYLTHDSFAVEPGTVMLVLAAAGGVGQLLVQMGTLRGARVLAVTSSTQKGAVARACGATNAWTVREAWAERCHEVTGGRGVDVVYDSVGTTLPDSLTAARVGGTVVFYGMAGGKPPAIDPRLLMDRSLTLTGGDLWNVLVSREERIRRAEVLFTWLRSGHVKPAPPVRLALSKGAEAHRRLESRRTTGKILLIP